MFTHYKKKAKMCTFRALIYSFQTTKRHAYFLGTYVDCGLYMFKIRYFTRCGISTGADGEFVFSAFYIMTRRDEAYVNDSLR